MTAVGEAFSVVVLAGGFGTRLGQEKASALAAGRPLLHWTAERLAPLTDDLWVVRRADQTLPAPPPGVRWREAIDRRAQAGPLAGIEAALLAIERDLMVAVATDMPLVEPALVRALVAAAEGHDVVMPVLDGVAQPLLAAYRRSALPAVQRRLEAGDGRIRMILPEVRARLLLREDLLSHDPALASFTNVNHREDLTRVAELLAKGPRARAGG